jgi:phage host-nuclease inhibitor protein Gam
MKQITAGQFKEETKQESESARKKAESAEAEQKRMRSVLAIFDNTANDEDLRINEEYRAKILDLRAEIQTLEKSA